MSLRTQRNDTATAILEKRFIAKVLREEGADINADIQKRMNSAGFKSGFWHDRSFSLTGGGNTLEYRHLKQHRFVDMKTRETKAEGKIRKKNYSIHNRVIYGHYNNIVRELMYGFTEAVKEELRQLEGDI